MKRVTKIIILLGVLCLLCVVNSSVADEVILNPGEIEGVLRIGSSAETNIEQARFYAYDTSDSSQNAQEYVYPNPPSYNVPYDLVVNVPAGSSTDYSIRVDQVYMDNYRDRMYFPNQTVTVDDVSPSTVDFIVDNPGFIEGTITVVGGGYFDWAQLYAYPASADPQIRSDTRFYSATNDSTVEFYRFPVAPGSGIRLQSNRVYLEGGAIINLPNSEVDVAPGETVVVNYVVETPQTGTVAGDISFSGAQSVDRYQIRMSGPVNLWEYLYANQGDISAAPGNAGAYSFDELPGGTAADPVTGYYMTVYSYLNSYDDYVVLPYSAFDPDRNPAVVAGVTTPVDIVAQQSYITGNINLTGVVNYDQINSAFVQYYGIYQTDSYGGNSRDNLDSSNGDYDVIVTPGDWYYSYVYLNFYNNDPAEYLNQWMYFYDYENGGQNNQITLAGPGNIVSRNYSYNTGSVEVTYTVAGGGTLSNPFLEGYCRLYEIPGDTSSPQVHYYSFRSYNYLQDDVTEGNVTLVGMEGSCEVQAKATVGETTTTFGDLTLNIVPGASQEVDIGGPTLVVQTPTPGECGGETQITVTGTVTDDTDVASVVVNGVAAALTPFDPVTDPPSYTFEATVPVSDGENSIVTVATDTADPANTSTDTRSVTVDATDDDQDGVLDCNDNCVGTANADQADSDGDGSGDACDGCPNDADKLEPGACGCGQADFDTDSDGTLDCNDGCPFDSGKTEEGVCGCGTADVDSDQDGIYSCQNDCNDDDASIYPGAEEVCDEIDHNCDGQIDDGFPNPYPNCLDQCPDDPNKTEPGICGCGVPDVDSDGDGSLDCNDGCPEDAGKLEPGVCGCGVADTDSDGDGTANCNDGCVDDANKTAPGVCGCGVADIDNDGDGEFTCQNDCNDNDASINPAATEVCDGFDNDCDGGLDNVDNDSDGVNDCNGTDKCLGTGLPELVPTVELKPNHYADVDGDGVLEVNDPHDGIVDGINLADVYGCSCEQILICKPGGNNGEQKFGCSPGTINVWTEQSGWAGECQAFTQSGEVVAYYGVGKSVAEDTDGDGVEDSVDEDDDNDGIVDSEDSQPDDSTGDGVPDWHKKKK